MNWLRPLETKLRLPVQAFLFFASTSGSRTRRPDVHSILGTLSISTLPEFVWVLFVIDRKAHPEAREAAFRLIGSGGQQIGDARYVDLSEISGHDLVVNWGHQALRGAIAVPGEYFGELSIDGVLAASTRLVITDDSQSDSRSARK